MAVHRDDLTRWLDRYLEVDRYEDAALNGLQLEGRERIARIAFAVSADRKTIEEAVSRGADALIVHHGLLWRFHGARRLVGPYARRLFPLIQNRVNLYGYHLPLDGHLEVGNAAVLAHKLDLIDIEPFGAYRGVTVGVKGRFPVPPTPWMLKAQLETILHHPVILATPDPQAEIGTVGIITGGASGEWRQAYEAGLDAYLTGEIKEHDWFESQEAGIHMFAGGHHATESFGIQALMEKVVETFRIEGLFIPSTNPA